jgi:hypothetical protein
LFICTPDDQRRLTQVYIQNGWAQAGFAWVLRKFGFWLSLH